MASPEIIRATSCWRFPRNSPRALSCWRSSVCPGEVQSAARKYPLIDTHTIQLYDHHGWTDRPLRAIGEECPIRGVHVAHLEGRFLDESLLARFSCRLSSSPGFALCADPGHWTKRTGGHKGCKHNEGLEADANARRETQSAGVLDQQHRKTTGKDQR